MRFLKRNLTIVSLYKPRFITDADGDGKNVCDGDPVDTFGGNIQPAGEDKNAQAYGIDPKYAYVVYVSAAESAKLRELDRITAAGIRYEIKEIRRWASYVRLLVEKRSSDG